MILNNPLLFGKQFLFYCDKPHYIRSDIVQTVVKLAQWSIHFLKIEHECFKQIEDCSKRLPVYL